MLGLADALGRDPAIRRTHIVELTPAGEEAFLRLRDAATTFDHRLRNGLTDLDLDGLAAMLGRLAGNVAGTNDPAPGRTDHSAAVTGGSAAGHGGG